MNRKTTLNQDGFFRNHDDPSLYWCRKPAARMLLQTPYPLGRRAVALWPGTEHLSARRRDPCASLCVDFSAPLSGYLSSSFSGYRTSFFGWPLPHWGWKDPVLNDFFSELHEANALLLVAALTHIAGAQRHALRPGDRVFRRMLP